MASRGAAAWIQRGEEIGMDGWDLDEK